MQRLHARARRNPLLAGALDRVSAVGRRGGCAMTYADLAADPRYAGAIEFFQNDLYGGGDFAQRDADLVRVVPVMMRVLPEPVIVTVARAVELNALSQELDRALLVDLPDARDGRFSGRRLLHGLSPRPASFRCAARQIRLIGESATRSTGSCASR